MNQVIFKNLDASELAREIVSERIDGLIEKFPDLSRHRIRTTLSMENSQFQAGEDMFTVKIHINGPRFQGVLVSKSAPNLYVAVADLMDLVRARLSQYAERKRTSSRRTRRQWAATGQRQSGAEF